MLRNNDLGIGVLMNNADLEMTTKEEQLKAFKRHEMTKALRAAWTQQQ